MVDLSPVEVDCIVCGKRTTQSEAKRVKGGWFCPSCAAQWYPKADSAVAHIDSPSPSLVAALLSWARANARRLVILAGSGVAFGGLVILLLWLTGPMGPRAGVLVKFGYPKLHAVSGVFGIVWGTQAYLLLGVVVTFAGALVGLSSLLVPSCTNAPAPPTPDSPGLTASKVGLVVALMLTTVMVAPAGVGIIRWRERAGKRAEEKSDLDAAIMCVREADAKTVFLRDVFWTQNVSLDQKAQKAGATIDECYYRSQTGWHAERKAWDTILVSFKSQAFFEVKSWSGSWQEYARSLRNKSVPSTPEDSPDIVYVNTRPDLVKKYGLEDKLGKD